MQFDCCMSMFPLDCLGQLILIVALLQGTDLKLSPQFFEICLADKVYIYNVNNYVLFCVHILQSLKRRQHLVTKAGCEPTLRFVCHTVTNM